ncbi:DUF4331 family protein [Gemmatimonas sp.]|uniref:DUF4331 family protein n=1 Tax=Gemmatimonas sp. TaxID=1962908 RepID=UPI003983A518
MKQPVSRRWTKWTRAVVAGVTVTVATAAIAVASDHMDTPLVEFNPKYDVNDVYAFPGSSPDRIVLVLGTQSPITPAATPTAAFGNANDVLYQLKIDNTGDGREDLVFQFTFSGEPGDQKVRVQGPVAPNEVGTMNTLVNGKREIQGAVNVTLGSASGMQVFAGPRDDPFYIDLEQFFTILPDRKPERGPLSQIMQGPLTFRPRDTARDFLTGFNDLAIVVELPLAEITANGANPRFGVWGTTSNARKNTLATN